MKWKKFKQRSIAFLVEKYRKKSKLRVNRLHGVLFNVYRNIKLQWKNKASSVQDNYKRKKLEAKNEKKLRACVYLRERSLESHKTDDLRIRDEEFNNSIGQVKVLRSPLLKSYTSTNEILTFVSPETKLNFSRDSLLNFSANIGVSEQTRKTIYLRH